MAKPVRIITNVSAADLRNKSYPSSLPGQTTLIQICDPRDSHVKVPEFAFIKTHAFKYLCNMDRQRESIEGGLTDSLALDILTALKEASDNNHNVICQCQMGSIRSATLVEVGAMLFDFEFSPGTSFDPSWSDARLLSKVYHKHFEEASE